jgi:hypothetical protein
MTRSANSTMQSRADGMPMRRPSIWGNADVSAMMLKKSANTIVSLAVLLEDVERFAI